MHLKKIEFDYFPEVHTLNHHFIADSKKLRYVLEASLDNTLLGRPKILNLENFYPYFKTLTSHTCGRCIESETRAAAYTHSPSDTILSVQEDVDIAHFMEHMILDLLFLFGGVKTISGVTVQLKGSSGEFITYVECDEPQLGIFCINYVMAVMHQALYCGTIDPRYHSVLALADRLRKFGISSKTLEEAKQPLKMDSALMLFCLNSLNTFHFSAQPIPFVPDLSPETIGPILLIDDNVSFLEVVSISLRSKGYETLIAANGQTGISRLCDYVAGIVLLDIYLPDVDGIAIAKWILETQPSTIIILTSGSIADSDGKQLHTKAIRFLPKPFDMLHLEKMILGAYSL